MLVELSSIFQSEVVTRISDELEPSSFQEVLVVAGRDPVRQQRGIEALIDRQVDGLTLIAPAMTQPWLEGLAANVPTVVVARQKGFLTSSWPTTSRSSAMSRTASPSCTWARSSSCRRLKGSTTSPFTPIPTDLAVVDIGETMAHAARPVSVPFRHAGSCGTLDDDDHWRIEPPGDGVGERRRCRKGREEVRRAHEAEAAIGRNEVINVELKDRGGMHGVVGSQASAHQGRDFVSDLEHLGAGPGEVREDAVPGPRQPLGQPARPAEHRPSRPHPAGTVVAEARLGRYLVGDL